MKPLLALLAALASPLLAQQPVRYQLRFPNAAHHEMEVRATFSGVKQPVLEVLISRSSPGRYALHEFAKNVYNFSARDARNQALDILRPSPYQWNVRTNGADTVIVDYTLFGDRADGTYAGIDSTHAHLNPPAVLAWAHGFEASPASIQIETPPNWRVFTQLPMNTEGTFSAPNRDRLMDAPLEIGPGSEHRWSVDDKVSNTAFRAAIHHQGTTQEAEAFAKALQRITAEEEGVFGTFPKYDDGLYTFLFDYLPYVSGDGMEHRNSTSITSAHDLANSAPDLLDTAAHEFFHSWNVKRIRPAALQPFDFERANVSGELWFAEGFTNYYGPLTLKRAGLWSQDRFTSDMARAITTVLTAPGREVRSPVEMSRMAPFIDSAAAIDAMNTPNNYISYYTYGQALALGIDLSIRSQYPGKSLDDWMRRMWQQNPDVHKPYTLDDLQNALAQVTDAVFAADIFRRHIHGKEPMDYKTLLAHAGFVLEPVTPAKTWLGASGITFDDKGAALNGVTLRGSPFYNAGLDRGDHILDWDGKALKSQKELDEFLATHKPGDHVKLNVQARGGNRSLDLTLANLPDLQIAAGESNSLREAWLSSKAVHPQPPVYKYCHVCKRTHPFEYDKCPYDGAVLHITPLAQ